MAAIAYKKSGVSTVDARRVDGIETELTRAFRAVDDTVEQWGRWVDVRAKANVHAKPWDIVMCDPSAAGFTVQLPDPKKCLGRWIIVKNVTTSANAITLRADGSANVDGASSASIAASLGTKCLRAFHDGWWSL